MDSTSEVKAFFKTNQITVEASQGGRPGGDFRVDIRTNHGVDLTTNLDNDDDDDVKGSIKLTIGEYSHEVILEPAADPVKPNVPFYVAGDNPPTTEEKNKKAITYIDSDVASATGWDGNGTTTVEALVNILIAAFPRGAASSNLAGRDRTDAPTLHDAWKSVPYGVSDLSTFQVDNLNLALVLLLDPQPMTKAPTIKFEGNLTFKPRNGDRRDTPFLRHEVGGNARIVKVNPIKNDEDDILLTLTSDVAGAGDKSTIGHPPTTGSRGPPYLSRAIRYDQRDNSANAGEAYVSSSDGVFVYELHVNPDESTVFRASTLPKVGSDSSTSAGGPKDLTERLGWL